MTGEHTITTSIGVPLRAAHIAFGGCKTTGIAWMTIVVTRMDGQVRTMCLDFANRHIKVDGVPVVDWYARQN